MGDLLQIEITSTCKTEPRHAEMNSKGYTQVQWHCGASKEYTLHLPGGVFEGYPDDFTVLVYGPEFVPETPLELNDTITYEQVIRNYVYDSSGNNCNLPRAVPPDILINP